MSTSATSAQHEAPTEQNASSGPRSGELTAEQKRSISLLGLPTLGLALAITVVSTYLPTVLHQFTRSNVAIGLLIGGEGACALLLPVFIGSWSDELRTRIGGRLPFVIAGTPIAAAALLGMGFVGALWQAALAVGVFFVGYYVAYEPYRALYPDLVPDEASGRAQSTQAIWRGVGTGLALLGGGLLLSAGQVIPFAFAAVMLLGACGIFIWLSVRWEISHDSESQTQQRVSAAIGQLREMLLHDPALRAFFFANALWELALAALKTFVILYLTQGLGVSLRGSALLVGGTALIILVGAGLAGKLADRFGRRQVMLVALCLFGGGMLVPFFVPIKAAVAASVPFIALGGGVLLALPYALLIPLMPAKHHGSLTGYYSVSRGLGIMLGPLLGGLAITYLGQYFGSTHGYAAMWGVCAAAVLASIPLLNRVRR